MADKKLFDGDLKTTPISTSQRIATGTPAGTTYNMTVDSLSDWIIGNIPTPPTTPILTKVVEIGGWDMQRNSGDAEKNVNLGVPKVNVRNIDVTILTTSSGKMYPLGHPDKNDEIKSEWSIVCACSTACVNLRAKANGFFDQDAFEGSIYNRGYITVSYVE